MNIKIPITAPGFAIANLPDAEVMTWFSTDPCPANQPESGLYYRQVDIGLKEKLTVCIKPADPKAFADQHYKQ